MTATAIAARMQGRKGALAAVLIFISLPVALALIEAVTYHARNRHNGTIVSSGRVREYLLHVPASYDRTKPTPLVISLHGGALWGAAQKEISRWNELADSQGFIVVYPSGTSGDGPRSWNAMPGSELMTDVRFISELIDSLTSEYNIESTRIYADGLSNGGGMAFVLSCALSGRIAAIGMVASAQMLPWSWCTDRRPMPMIAFHGTADPVVPYAGGKTWVGPWRFPSVAEWAANWADRNGCARDPVDTVVARDVIRRSYMGCVGDSGVVLFTVLGGGHTWPGGRLQPQWFIGRTSEGVDATSEMWAFFSAHRLRN